jgi:uncharacterized membrane protein YdjX (TVP38/TMEM64 family)
MKRWTNGTWIKFCFLLGLFLLIAALYESGAFHFFMDRKRIIFFLNSLGPFSFIGFISLQILQVVAAPIPGEVTGFLGGYMYGVPLGIFFSTIGLTAGSLGAFILSRVFGRPFVEKMLKKETIERFNFTINSNRRRASFLIFLLFLLPGFPKDYLCYILGLGPMSIKEFLVISTVGRFSGTSLLTLGGAYIRNQQYYRFFVLVGVTVVIILISMAYRDRMERFLRRLGLQ